MIHRFLICSVIFFHCLMSAMEHKMRSEGKDHASDDVVAMLQGHTDWVSDIAYLNEKRLISSSRDKTIKLWDVSKSSCISTVDHLDEPQSRLAASSSCFVSGGDCDGYVTLWDVGTGKRVRKVKFIKDDEPSKLYTLTLAKQAGLVFATYRGQNFPRQNDPRCSYISKIFTATTAKGPRKFCVNEQGTKIAVSEADGNVSIYTLGYRKPVCTLKVYDDEDSMHALSFTADGSTLVAAGQLATKCPSLALLDVASGKLVRKIESELALPKSFSASIDVSPDSTSRVGVCVTASVVTSRIWSLSSASAHQRNIKPATLRISAVRFNPQADMFAMSTRGKENVVRVYNVPGALRSSNNKQDNVKE